MRKFVTALICFCFILTGNLEAQENNQYSGSLLWKISGKGMSKPSYILGTHHLTNPSFLDQIAGYTEAFEQSEVVVGELDMSDKETLMQEVQQSLMIGEGEKGYKDLLSDEELENLNANLLKHLSIPLTPFIQAKPAVITTFLGIKLHAAVDPTFNPQSHVAMDEYIQKRAKEENKQIKGLENAQEQIDALFSDPIEEQLKDLICALNEMELGELTYKKLNEYYESGNLTALYNLMTDKDPDVPQSACPMTEEKKNKMIDYRNQAWMKKIPDLIKSNSTLIVVGAGHLPGENGLLTLLSKKGHKIEAVQ